MSEYKEGDGWEIFACAVILLFFCAIAFGMGYGIKDTASQNEAVKAGVAEYYLDSQNVRQFRFKTK